MAMKKQSAPYSASKVESAAMSKKGHGRKAGAKRPMPKGKMKGD